MDPLDEPVGSSVDRARSSGLVAPGRAFMQSIARDGLDDEVTGYRPM